MRRMVLTTWGFEKVDARRRYKSIATKTGTNCIRNEQFLFENEHLRSFKISNCLKTMR